jgi:putative endonuclease
VTAGEGQVGSGGTGDERRPTSERPASERSPSERSPSERPASERPATERPARRIPAGARVVPRRQLGQSGEDAVAQWYLDHGYEVVARNWRCRDGELDLVLRRSRQFVFCEVKARTTTAFGVPAEAVNRRKQARIRRLAARWLQDDAPVRAASIRFDVASVLAGQIEVIEGAF